MSRVNVLPKVWGRAGNPARVGGGGNATVPSDAPIQPPQAFVDVAQDYLANYPNWSSTTLENRGITWIDPTLTFYIIDGGGGNFQGNSISNTDEILAAAAASGIPGLSINLSGGNNAVPTPDLPALIHTVADIVTPFEFNGLSITFNNAIPLSESVDFDIGTSDSPSIADVAAKIIEMDGGASLEYFSLGSTLIKHSLNSDVAYLMINGGTVIVNEYINRVSGPTEVVTYSP